MLSVYSPPRRLLLKRAHVHLLAGLVADGKETVQAFMTALVNLPPSTDVYSPALQTLHSNLALACPRSNIPQTGGSFRPILTSSKIGLFLRPRSLLLSCFADRSQHHMLAGHIAPFVHFKCVIVCPSSSHRDS